MAVRRRAAALGPGLVEDLIAAGLGARDEHGDLLANDVQGAWRGCCVDNDGFWHGKAPPAESKTDVIINPAARLARIGSAARLAAGQSSNTALPTPCRTIF